MTISDIISARRVRWVVPVLNPRRAGLRYRCLYPMQELLRHGRDVGLWQGSESADSSLSLVFDAWSVFTTNSSSKSAAAVIEVAEAAKRKGARIILDNCDNQFASIAATPEWRDGLERLRRLACIADVIVTCSSALSGAMQAHIDGPARYIVIDDPIEERIAYPGDTSLKSLLSPWRKLAWIRLLQHRIALAGEQLARRTPLVWFGSHGNQFSPGGMNDILPLRLILEQVSKSYPISLTVISNQRKKFDAHFRHWRIPTHYLEWDRITFLSALKMHEISIIPSVDNAFTRCKSSNRLTLSIYHGLSVLADPIPSYLPFQEVIRIGDWERNLVQLLGNRTQRKAQLLTAQTMVRSWAGLKNIAAQWDCALFQKF